MKSQTDRLRDFLLARPRRWCAMHRLEDEIGAHDVDSRVADLRQEGLVVVNKIRVMGGQRWSFYRYMPVEICDGCGAESTYPLHLMECGPFAGAYFCSDCLISR